VRRIFTSESNASAWIYLAIGLIWATVEILRFRRHGDVELSLTNGLTGALFIVLGVYQMIKKAQPRIGAFLIVIMSLLVACFVWTVLSFEWRGS